MSDKIQREIEWSDSSDGPQREATHNSPTPRRKFLPVQGQELTMNARAFLGRHIESKDGALDFGPRRFDRLARFLGQGAREFVFALNHGLSDPAHYRSEERRVGKECGCLLVGVR